MNDVAVRTDAKADQDWPLQIYQTLKANGVSQISYVPPPKA